ncbi:MAG TPA: amidohydrolase family protein, partial [Bryobacteraceae bacterium]|nr:amidohydrolase family protein [Bryobacteraceae bacterium]
TDETDWLQSVRTLRTAPARALSYQTRRFLQFLAKHGTTTVESKSGRIADEGTELKNIRILAELHARPLNIVMTYEATHLTLPDAQLEMTPSLWHTTYLLPKIAGRKQVRFAEIGVGESAFTHGEARLFLTNAIQLGMTPKVRYADATFPEILLLLREMNVPVVDGIRDCSLTEAHALAELGTVAVVTLPMRDGTPRRCIEHLRESGVSFALATGFDNERQPVFNMQAAIGIACREGGLTAAEAITAATINGAYACAEASRTGSIQFGKDADVLLLNVSDYRELVHHFGANLVHMTLRQGEVVFREGELNWPAL